MSDAPYTNPLFNAALPHVQAWLASCQNSEDLLSGNRLSDYALWSYQRDAMGVGTLELINNPSISLGANLLALSLSLDLPPIQSPDEAYLLFSLSDAFDGAAIVCKGDDHTLAVQLKVPLADVTAETLPNLYARLTKAKRFLEEP